MTEHEPEYFQAAVSSSLLRPRCIYSPRYQENLNDQQLTAFGSDDFILVRVAVSAYGIHIFGKIRIPDLPDGYIHFRAFDTGPGGEPPKLHSIHTEEKEHASGDKTYRAIFTKDDTLEWFDT